VLIIVNSRNHLNHFLYDLHGFNYDSSILMFLSRNSHFKDLKLMSLNVLFNYLESLTVMTHLVENLSYHL